MNHIKSLGLYRFGDRFCIVGGVLLAHRSGAHLPGIVAQRLELAAEMMRANASLQGTPRPIVDKLNGLA